MIEVVLVERRKTHSKFTTVDHHQGMFKNNDSEKIFGIDPSKLDDNKDFIEIRNNVFLHINFLKNLTITSYGNGFYIYEIESGFRVENVEKLPSKVKIKLFKQVRDLFKQYNSLTDAEKLAIELDDE